MVWKTLKENNLYECNDLGEVRRIGKKKPLKGTKNKKGYLRITLSGYGIQKDYFIHQLIANNFLPVPTSEQLQWAKKSHYGLVQVNHINGIKDDNRAINLEWVTNKENCIHAYKTGLIKMKKGSTNLHSKLSIDDVKYLISNYKPRDKLCGLMGMANRFNVSKTTIQKYLKNNLH